MAYVDGFLAAVPDDKKDAYLEHARFAAEIFKEFGAQRVVECWEDDVPDGKVTDFRRSVQRKDGEKSVNVVHGSSPSWVVQASAAARSRAAMSIFFMDIMAWKAALARAGFGSS